MRAGIFIWKFAQKGGLYTNNVPIYGGNLDAEVRDTVPYDNMELVRETNKKEMKLAAEIRKLRSEFVSLDEKVAAVMRG